MQKHQAQLKLKTHMNKLKNNSGFSVVEALLILIVIGILGFTGWFVYHARQTADKNLTSNNSTTPTYKKSKSSASADVNQYVGWKTFCSAETDACFKYDPSWTFTECAPKQVNEQGHFQNCGSMETVSVISPNNLRINWTVDPYDATATNECTQGKTSYPGVTYSDSTKVQNSGNLFFVNVKESPNGTTYVGDPKYDYVGHLALTTGINGQQPTVGQAGALCPPGPAFVAKDGKFKITFSYSYSVNTNPKLPASDQDAAPAQADLDKVKQTLLSFYYK